MRAHRLWESYQVDTMGLTESQIHDEADRLEHLLSEEILDEVDAKLGFPITDPHGSPIPPKSVVGADSLLSLRPKTRSKISENQKNQKIVNELWELGLLPKAKFSVEKIGSDYVKINVSNKSVTIPAHLAKEIKVELIK